MDTMINSRMLENRRNSDAVLSSPYRKLQSPELLPLPPLSREFRLNGRNIDGAGLEKEKEEEFFSPRGSFGSISAAASSPRKGLGFPVGVESKKKDGRPNPSELGSPPSSATASPLTAGQTKAFSPSWPSISPLQGSLNGPSARPLSSPSVNFSKTPWGALPSNSPSPRLFFRSQDPPSSIPNLWTIRDSSSSPSPSTGKDLDEFAHLGERIQDHPSQNKPPPALANGEFHKNPSSASPTPSPPLFPPAGFGEPPPFPPSPFFKPGPRPPVLFAPSRTMESKKQSTQIAVSAMEPPGNSDSEEKKEETPKLKPKPLHWDMVRTSSHRAMVWDQLSSSSFRVNEDMIETLFVCKPTNFTPKGITTQTTLASTIQENRLLDPKMSRYISILLTALNVTEEEVCEALLEGNTNILDVELLEILLKLAPTTEEEFKLNAYKNESPVKLGPAERFLKAVLDIPFAFKRVDAMLYISNFDSEVNYLMKSFEILQSACGELKSSRMFLKLLDAVLEMGNKMNVGSAQIDAHALKLDTLMKLLDVKGTDGKTTLLHFVVEEIISVEGSSVSSTDQSDLIEDIEMREHSLEVISGLCEELSNVKKAADIGSDVLGSYVSKVASGVEKIREVMRLNDGLSSDGCSKKFSNAMSEFLKKAEEDIAKVQAHRSDALFLVKEITEYFHGDSAKEEAHPLRIFMVVSDFLSILEQVCKEVEKTNHGTINSLERRFPTSPSIFQRFHSQLLQCSSGDDSDT